MMKQLTPPLASFLSLFLIASAYEVHEWGTFTTLSGSDGTNLSGLHVEEEHLPSFVYSHAGMEPRATSPFEIMRMPNELYQNEQVFVREINKELHLVPQYSKGMNQANLKQVTVKMETPVLYFYGDQREKVNVKVGFHGGTIAQWYPQRTSGDTPNLYAPRKGQKIQEALSKLGEDRLYVTMDPIDFSKGYKGAIEWDVDMIPRAQADAAYTFKSAQNATWIYPRVDDAAMLKVGDEYEDYLFYRGLGNFNLPAVFSVDDAETLQISNNGAHAIPFALAYEKTGETIRYKVFSNGVAGGSVATVADDAWTIPASHPQVEIFQAMRAGLTAQGLTHDEAEGMVKTWWKSYFDKDGLRVFWVVPQPDLETVLPIELTPAPEKIVRVMVGRADVLRPRFEKQLMENFGSQAYQATYFSDRFRPAYRERLKTLFGGKPVYPKFENNQVSVMMETVDTTQKNAARLQLMPGGHAHGAAFGKSFRSWQKTGEYKIQIEDLHFVQNPDTGEMLAEPTEDMKARYAGISAVKIQLPNLLQ